MVYLTLLDVLVNGDLMYKEENVGEKYSEFINVRFLLASEMRPRLLLLLLEDNYDLNSLRDILKKPSASVLHGLNELEALRLVQREIKSYSLTSKGTLYAVVLKKLFRDLYIFRTHVDFWQDHSIESIPIEFFRNSYLLKDSIFVESDEENLSKPSDKIMELLSSCDDMKIILPIFLDEHLEKILENLEKGHHLLLITNEEVLDSLKDSIYYDYLYKYSKMDQLGIRKVEDDLKIFLAICRNGMALNLFFKDDLFDNSCVIFNDTEDGLEWANQLFEFYYKKSIKII